MSQIKLSVRELSFVKITAYMTCETKNEILKMKIIYKLVFK